jgi:hypothetical protein
VPTLNLKLAAAPPIFSSLVPENSECYFDGVVEDPVVFATEPDPEEDPLSQSLPDPVLDPLMSEVDKDDVCGIEGTDVEAHSVIVDQSVAIEEVLLLVKEEAETW